METSTNPDEEKGFKLDIDNLDKIPNMLRSRYGRNFTLSRLENSLSTEVRDILKDQILPNLTKAMNQKDMQDVGYFILATLHFYVESWQKKKKEDVFIPKRVKASAVYNVHIIEPNENDEKNSSISPIFISQHVWDKLMLFTYVAKLKALHPNFMSSITFIMPGGEALLKNIGEAEMGMSLKKALKKLKNTVIANITLADNSTNIIRYGLNLKSGKTKRVEEFNVHDIDEAKHAYASNIPNHLIEGKISIGETLFYLNSLDINMLRRKIVSLPNGQDLIKVNSSIFAKMGMDLIQGTQIKSYDLQEVTAREFNEISNHEGMYGKNQSIHRFFNQWYNQTK